MNLHQSNENSPRRLSITCLAGDGASLMKRHWKFISMLYLAVIIGSITTYSIILTHVRPFDLRRRAWGGFDQRPTNATCYQRERTAMLLSFTLGSLGVDQFYAHHWPLAVFKLLTLGAGGIWWFVDVILWIVGGIYGTPGCPGGSKYSWQY